MATKKSHKAATATKATAENRGASAAREWLETASVDDAFGVAGSPFSFGMTLDDLIAAGWNVPHSSDKDFSWGFFKHVNDEVERIKRVWVNKHLKRFVPQVGTDVPRPKLSVRGR